MAVQISEEEWRLKLSPEQFRVLREKGTERAGTGMKWRWEVGGWLTVVRRE
jgi:peptide methionine sulfoxide reductase MsrB